jgi:hypothetical protein
MERRYVRQVLNAVGGNKTHAARILGIDRRSLYRRLEEPRHDAKAADGGHAVSHARTVPIALPHATNGHGANGSVPPASATRAASHSGEAE